MTPKGSHVLEVLHEVGGAVEVLYCGVSAYPIRLFEAVNARETLTASACVNNCTDSCCPFSRQRQDVTGVVIRGIGDSMDRIGGIGDDTAIVGVVLRVMAEWYSMLYLAAIQLLSGVLEVKRIP